MKQVTFIVSDNGFGHYKRCSKIANALIKNDNIFINFLCNKDLISRDINSDLTKSLITNNRVLITNYISPIKLVKSKKNDSAFDLLISEKSVFPINFINDSDLTISDNVTNVLQFNEDIILMGSFLWSDLYSREINYNDIIIKYFENEISLLKKIKPEMICLKEMASKNVKKYTKPFFTSWLVNPTRKNRKKSIIKNILVLGGGTAIVEDIINSIISVLLKKSNYNIYCSEYEKHKFISERVYEFNFEENSFFNIDLIIARPGIGIITDCIDYYIPILAISEKNNYEMINNIQKIEKMKIGLGIDLEKINNLDKLIQNIPYKYFLSNLSSISRNGISETIEFINKKLN